MSTRKKDVEPADLGFALFISKAFSSIRRTPENRKECKAIGLNEESEATPGLILLNPLSYSLIAGCAPLWDDKSAERVVTALAARCAR